MKTVIKDNRSFIMGLAILWIALYHIPTHTGIPILSFLQDVGYGGVDIFFFVSGFGVYLSLEKDSDAYGFICRRFGRLLPSYIPFIIVWMIIRYVTYQLYATEIAGNLTMTGWWNGSSNQFNWYVDGIVLFYILSPYLYGAIKRRDNGEVKGNHNGKEFLWLVGIIGLSLLISVSFWHGLLLTAFSRLPIYILGMIVSSDKLKKMYNGRWSCAVWNFVMILGMVMLYYLLYQQDIFDRWHYGLWWYPFFLITPGLVYDLGLIGELLKKNTVVSWIDILISYIGKASFEIFLIHLFVFETAGAKHIEGKILWFGMFVASILGGVLYHRFVKEVLAMLQRKFV